MSNLLLLDIMPSDSAEISGILSLGNTDVEDIKSVRNISGFKAIDAIIDHDLAQSMDDEEYGYAVVVEVKKIVRYQRQSAIQKIEVKV